MWRGIGRGRSGLASLTTFLVASRWRESEVARGRPCLNFQASEAGNCGPPAPGLTIPVAVLNSPCRGLNFPMSCSRPGTFHALSQASLSLPVWQMVLLGLGSGLARLGSRLAFRRLNLAPSVVVTLEHLHPAASKGLGKPFEGLRQGGDAISLEY